MSDGQGQGLGLLNEWKRQIHLKKNTTTDIIVHNKVNVTYQILFLI